MFSKSSLILTAILIAGLGLVVWRSGGTAFSPGKLSTQTSGEKKTGGYQSHADFESQCVLCHRPFESTLSELCVDCHQEVSIQMSSGEGVHGRISGVEDCASCHTEHRGKGFNLLEEAYQKYNHSGARFNLIKHQINYTASPIQCKDCHELDGKIAFQPDTCSQCHDMHLSGFTQEHTQYYGSDCLVCHDGTDRMIGFEHQLTSFPLDGQHADLTCKHCHNLQASSDSRNLFVGIPMECAGCHEQPEVHAGLFEESCETCHTSAGWAPALWQGALFDHFTSTGFSLELHETGYDGAPLRCNSCHEKISVSIDQEFPVEEGDFLEQVCLDCHEAESPGSILDHVEQTGGGCLECHDGVDRMMGFSHDDMFVLDGAHIELSCLDCHATSYANTSGDCVSCHQEPEIHQGFFGTECQSCHSTQAWTPALMKSHNFPIDHGGEGVVECKTCHPDTYTAYTCYSCHEHQVAEVEREHLEEGISSAELPDCVRCHPSGREE